MKALEILSSVSCHPLFARMEDGSFRWLTDDLRLLSTGPNPQWVERGLAARAASLHGEMNTQRPLCHDILLNTVNARLEGK